MKGITITFTFGASFKGAAPVGPKKGVHKNNTLGDCVFTTQQAAKQRKKKKTNKQKTKTKTKQKQKHC